MVLIRCHCYSVYGSFVLWLSWWQWTLIQRCSCVRLSLFSQSPPCHFLFYQNYIVLQPGQLCSWSLPHSLVTSLWGSGYLWSALCKTLSSITMNELCSLTCFKFSLISSCPLAKWEYISILPEVSWKFFVCKNFVDVFTLRFWSYRRRSQQASPRPTERRCSFLSPHALLLPLRCLP